MIEASLRENAIHFRTISDGAARTAPKTQSDPSAPVPEATSIFVLPEDEARAQEIVREITDATPPKINEPAPQAQQSTTYEDGLYMW